jgi:hypothetical protein
MRGSPVATRDDDNSVVTMRRYRRANEAATPKLVWGCRSWSRPVTPTPSSSSPTPSSCPSSSSSSKSYPPPSVVFLSPEASKSSSNPAASSSSSCPKLSSSWKMECKEISKFILQNGMKIKKITSSLWKQIVQPTKDESMCFIISASQLMAVLQPRKRVCTVPTLLFPPKSFFMALFNFFDILFKTSTSEYSWKT